MKLSWLRGPVFSIPVIVALIFGAFAATALTAVGTTANAFTNELGIRPWVFVAQPALTGTLFAILIFQGAERNIKTVLDAISRGFMVAAVTWVALAVMAATTWCIPREFGKCLRTALLVSGAIGGGPLLLAAVVAGAIGGLVILRRASRYVRSDDGA